MENEIRNGNSLFRTVIFATDFSFYSQNAGLYAAFLAQQFRAELLVLHAFCLSQPALEAEYGSELKSRQRIELEEFLGRSASRLSGAGIQAKPMLVEGDPPKVINKTSEQHEGSIIVLGTHGGSAAMRLVLGSSAENILRTVSCPSLTVGPRVPPLIPETGHFKRVLYATELDHSVSRAGTYALSIAEKFNSEIDVLHVIDPNQLKHPEDLKSIKAEFYSEFGAIAPTSARLSRAPESIIEVGDAHKEILRHIQEFSVDLLVLGIRRTTHVWMESARSGVFGIVAHAPCPVLTIVS
jgi:nucleotide-binding universal stress UspA family protein